MDPAEKLILELKGKASSYGSKTETAAEKLKQDQKDYDNYVEKIEILDSMVLSVSTCINYLNTAKGQLKNYSAGNKAQNANGLFDGVIGMVSSVASDGIESIRIYIMKDMEKLVKDYSDEYPTYETNITNYNNTVADLRSLGEYSYKRKEVTITKRSLV